MVILGCFRRPWCLNTVAHCCRRRCLRFFGNTVSNAKTGLFVSATLFTHIRNTRSNTLWKKKKHKRKTQERCVWVNVVSGCSQRASGGNGKCPEIQSHTKPPNNTNNNHGLLVLLCVPLSRDLFFLCTHTHTHTLHKGVCVCVCVSVSGKMCVCSALYSKARIIFGSPVKHNTLLLDFSLPIHTVWQIFCANASQEAAKVLFVVVVLYGHFIYREWHRRGMRLLFYQVKKCQKIRRFIG